MMLIRMSVRGSRMAPQPASKEPAEVGFFRRLVARYQVRVRVRVRVRARFRVRVKVRMRVRVRGSLILTLTLHPNPHPHPHQGFEHLFQHDEEDATALCGLGERGTPTCNNCLGNIKADATIAWDEHFKHLVRDRVRVRVRVRP